MEEQLLTLFAQICSKQTLDKNMMKEAKASKTLKTNLRKILKDLSYDEEVLFNWFIGSQFNLCINELR